MKTKLFSLLAFCAIAMFAHPKQTMATDIPSTFYFYIYDPDAPLGQQYTVYAVLETSQGWYSDPMLLGTSYIVGDNFGSTIFTDVQVPNPLPRKAYRIHLVVYKGNDYRTGVSDWTDAPGLNPYPETIKVQQF